MQVWDYLDRHEFIGTFVVLCVALIIMGTIYKVAEAIASVFIAWAQAWGQRRR